MYAIIYFKSDETIYPFTWNGKFKVFERLKEADEFANTIEESLLKNIDIQLRVISLDSVHE